MKGISPQLDQLMWVIAESQDAKAIDEFGQKHPELRSELTHRLAMVRSLRSAGKHTDQATRIPQFRPVSHVRQAPPRRTVAVVSALGLAALAMATYTVTSFVVASHQSPVERTQPLPPPTPKVVTSDVKAPETVHYTNQLPQPEVPEPSPEPTVAAAPSYLKPQNLKIERAKLSQVLQMVAAQGGLKLDIGPGLPDPDVRAVYHNISPVAILEDLGRTYGFTAFDQGNGAVIVIPAVDKSKQAQTPSEQKAEVREKGGVEKTLDPSLLHKEPATSP